MTNPNSDNVIGRFLVNVADQHRAQVQGVLLDLLFYEQGFLSYHHASPFVKALLSNRLSYICQRADSVNILYLAVYGEFLYECIPPEKLISP